MPTVRMRQCATDCKDGNQQAGKEAVQVHRSCGA
jgi:hypothetical protein